MNKIITSSVAAIAVVGFAIAPISLALALTSHTMMKCQVGKRTVTVRSEANCKKLGGKLESRKVSERSRSQESGMQGQGNMQTQGNSQDQGGMQDQNRGQEQQGNMNPNMAPGQQMAPQGGNQGQQGGSQNQGGGSSSGY